jgi:hypothetical protein
VKKECYLCGGPPDTRCESCAQCVCYGCLKIYEDCDVCNKCDLRLRDEEKAEREKGEQP